jgi:hypothetical protein
MMTKQQSAFRLVREANKAEVILFHSKMAGGQAHDGWGQGDDFIETKVYGTPSFILKTIRDGEKMIHTHFSNCNKDGLMSPAGWFAIKEEDIPLIKKAVKAWKPPLQPI